MANQLPHPVLPQAPVDLLAIAVGSCQVMLAWTESGIGGLGFRIKRAGIIGLDGPFLEIGHVGPHVAAYRDGTVLPRTTYRYRVHAWNAVGESSPSGVAEVTTPRAEAEQSADGE